MQGPPRAGWGPGIPLLLFQFTQAQQIEGSHPLGDPNAEQSSQWWGAGAGSLGLPLGKTLVLQVEVRLLCPEALGVEFWSFKECWLCFLWNRRNLTVGPPSTPAPSSDSPGVPVNSLCLPGEGLGVGGKCQELIPCQGPSWDPDQRSAGGRAGSRLDLPSRGGKEEAVGTVRRRV